MASPHGISLQVTIHIAPENVEKFFALIKPVYDLVIAEKECRFFEIYQSQEDPGAVSWVEHWDGTVQWLFDVQLKKDYYPDYLAATEPMFIKPREFTILNRVGPPFSMSKDAGICQK